MNEAAQTFDGLLRQVDAAWLAELDHRLGLGGSLQSGREEPASGWKRFWK